MVKKEFFGDGLKFDVQKFVAECLVCQQNKVETIKTLGLLQPIDRGKNPSQQRGAMPIPQVPIRLTNV